MASQGWLVLVAPDRYKISSRVTSQLYMERLDGCRRRFWLRNMVFLAWRSPLIKPEVIWNQISSKNRMYTAFQCSFMRCVDLVFDLYITSVKTILPPWGRLIIDYFHSYTFLTCNMSIFLTRKHLADIRWTKTIFWIGKWFASCCFCAKQEATWTPLEQIEFFVHRSGVGHA